MRLSCFFRVFGEDGSDLREFKEDPVSLLDKLDTARGDSTGSPLPPGSSPDYLIHFNVNIG